MFKLETLPRFERNKPNKIISLLKKFCAHLFKKKKKKININNQLDKTKILFDRTTEKF